jgi:hypothetical protein
MLRSGKELEEQRSKQIEMVEEEEIETILIIKRNTLLLHKLKQ